MRILRIPTRSTFKITQRNNINIILLLLFVYTTLPVLDSQDRATGEVSDCVLYHRRGSAVAEGSRDSVN